MPKRQAKPRNPKRQAKPRNPKRQAKPRKPKRSDAVADDVFDALLKLYEDPRSAGSFGGINKLLRAAKAANINVNQQQVRRFLFAVPAYGIHRWRGPKAIPRRAIISPDVDWLWEIDIAYVDQWVDQNDGYLYLLVKIDVLSKQLAVEPLHDKTAKVTLEGLRRICERIGTIPVRIAADGGREFDNNLVKTWASDNGIRIYYVPQTEQGAAVVERVIETLKVRLARFMRDNHTGRYIDDLQNIVDGYNATYHSSIGMAPVQVTDANAEQVRERLYPHTNFPRAPYKFAVGDKVRAAVKRRAFHRGFFPQFSQQVFVVAKRLRSLPAMYRLAKLDGTPVKSRGYYESHLLPVQQRRRETLNALGLEDEADEDDARPLTRPDQGLEEEADEDEPGPSRKRARRY